MCKLHVLIQFGFFDRYSRAGLARHEPPIPRLRIMILRSPSSHFATPHGAGRQTGQSITVRTLRIRPDVATAAILTTAAREPPHLCRLARSYAKLHRERLTCPAPAFRCGTGIFHLDRLMPDHFARHPTIPRVQSFAYCYGYVAH